ncbi:MAG: transglycosylase SLT domain-containing protein [Paraglaciecola sp.]|uniref:transglycosylase SLT domain-containing protein n=1 Tax=Paraglaciecola sp. TaxID=1920173 RepID=UPI00273F2AC2|nr:murein transglycosylase domain-containing protein [Paraglaciecola sp.]MDP5031399.1 transglycosylase SLT domain-containing protein [Paraglaciecola sp.]MDP5133175.1 transglycosylase SLT domain-containing protein [Paraglaciecola sp.]
MQVKLAVEKAYQGLTEKISVNWQDDVTLPNAKSWTTYDDTLTTRATFDFEEGVYRIESLLEHDVVSSLSMLKAFAVKVAQSNQSQLADADVFKQALEKELTYANAKQNLVSFSPPTSPYVHTDDILANDTVAQIEALIEEAVLSNQSGNSAAAQVLIKTTPTKIDSVGSKLKKNASSNLLLSEADVAAAQPSTSLIIQTNKSVNKFVLSIPFINGYQKKLLESKIDLVKELANKYSLDVSLILAIIETESSFNPMAMSPVPAFGLMQLVPSTAGVDAYEYLYGQRKVVEPDYLFDQNNNLKLGVTYIHLLSSRYLRGVQNTQSRLYCILASYNTGVGNLARTFVNKKSLQLAITKINSLRAEQTYSHLMDNLPAQETKHYLQKVLARKKTYISFDL